LRRYVNVFVEQEDGRWPGEADTQLESGKQVWIVPNIAGGAALKEVALERSDPELG